MSVVGDHTEAVRGETTVSGEGRAAAPAEVGLVLRLVSGLLKRLDMREVSWSKSWFSGRASRISSIWSMMSLSRPRSKVPMLDSQLGCFILDGVVRATARERLGDESFIKSYQDCIASRYS